MGAGEAQRPLDDVSLRLDPGESSSPGWCDCSGVIGDIGGGERDEDNCSDSPELFEAMLSEVCDEYDSE